MSLKISDLTLTGSAPTGAMIPIAYDSANYRVSASNVVTSAQAALLFDGTGSFTIHRSENISSITDGGAGQYTLNFTSNIPNGILAATCPTAYSNSFDGSTRYSATQIENRGQPADGSSMEVYTRRSAWAHPEYQGFFFSDFTGINIVVF